MVVWIQPDEGATPDPAALRRILQAQAEPADAAPDATSRFVGAAPGRSRHGRAKATELLRGAGLPVHQVERGMRIDLAGWPDDAGRQAALAKRCCTTR